MPIAALQPRPYTRAMKLTIRTHHASVDGDFEALAEKKLGRLERYLPRVHDAVVEVGHEETRAAANRYAVQVTVHAAGSILRAEERAADPKRALEVAADVLSQQARRHKQRLDGRTRRRGAKEAAAELATPAGAEDFEPEDGEDADEYLLGKIVRVKRFEAKPMSQEEALAQMDLIGHDFFLFLDASSGDYALLYKRRDGDYGMLAPHRG